MKWGSFFYLFGNIYHYLFIHQRTQLSRADIGKETWTEVIEVCVQEKTWIWRASPVHRTFKWSQDIRKQKRKILSSNFFPLLLKKKKSLTLKNQCFALKSNLPSFYWKKLSVMSYNYFSFSSQSGIKITTHYETRKHVFVFLIFVIIFELSISNQNLKT